jgi:hypothetical protein
MLARKPPLTEAQILSWADAHRARTGRWPSWKGGRVHGAPGETWRNLNQALRLGLRGLPGGDTLLRLLRRSGRHVPERRGRPRKVKSAALLPCPPATPLG